MLEIVVIVASYLLGCLSTGYYLVRLRTGQDIRSIGSGSTGTRNVGRLLGIKGLIITALGDLAKGAIALGIALHLELELWGVMLVMVAIVAGHIWPIQLRFKGGRGVMTAMGVLLILDYRLVLVALLLTGLVYIPMHRFTMSGLIAIILSPAIALVFGHPTVIVIGIAVLAFIILIAHKSYIRQLFGAI